MLNPSEAAVPYSTLALAFSSVVQVMVAPENVRVPEVMFVMLGAAVTLPVVALVTEVLRDAYAVSVTVPLRLVLNTAVVDAFPLKYCATVRFDEIQLNPPVLLVFPAMSRPTAVRVNVPLRVLLTDELDVDG